MPAITFDSRALTVGNGWSRLGRIVLLGLLATAFLVPVFLFQGMTLTHSAIAAAWFVAPGLVIGWHVWTRLTRTVKGQVRLTLAMLVRHAIAALACGCAWVLSFGILCYLIKPSSTLGYLRDGAIWQLFWGSLLYGGLAWVAWFRARLQDCELIATRAELIAVRAQLNPHFLFNTLHSLGQLAQEDPPATQQALQRFGDLMRHVLTTSSDPNGEVTLGDELRFVRSYLALEALRFGDRLRFEESIEQEALGHPFPPMTLQPLVENAIRHGLAPLREGGTICLKACVEDGALMVDVSDDGAGCEESDWRFATGIGLRSIGRQLASKWRGHMVVRTRPGTGFAVKLRLPLESQSAAA